jgi:hemoglobin
MNALPLATAPSNPHYERLGGAAAVERLVNAFYAAMDRRVDARAIRAMHGPDLTATKAVLVKYLAEWLGGPRQYTAERGPPRLRRAHQPYPIDRAARDAWLACMRQALAETGTDPDLARALHTAFAKVADHLHDPATTSTHRSS